MNDLEKRFVETFEKLGFYEYRKISTNEIVITQDVFDQCKRNTCGNFGKNHACPPRAGTEEERRARLTRYKDGFVVNYIASIKSSKDMKESMEIISKANDDLRLAFDGEDVMVLASGPCKFCETCAALMDEPCRFPDKTQYSMEGCGIDVVRMSINLKMTYNAGMGNAAFFTLVLYNNN